MIGNLEGVVGATCLLFARINGENIDILVNENGKDGGILVSPLFPFLENLRLSHWDIFRYI